MISQYELSGLSFNVWIDLRHEMCFMMKNELYICTTGHCFTLRLSSLTFSLFSAKITLTIPRAVSQGGLFLLMPVLLELLIGLCSH